MRKNGSSTNALSALFLNRLGAVKVNDLPTTGTKLVAMALLSLMIIGALSNGNNAPPAICPHRLSSATNPFKSSVPVFAPSKIGPCMMAI